ncbi:MAG: hypothetical protein ACMG6E_03030 [Candidatus Roizmanbacteria bacterium]
MEVSTDLYDAVYDLWNAIEAGATFEDAYEEYESELDSAIIAAAEYIVENDIDLLSIIDDMITADSETTEETTEA